MSKFCKTGVSWTLVMLMLLTIGKWIQHNGSSIMNMEKGFLGAFGTWTYLQANDCVNGLETQDVSLLLALF